MIFSFEFLVEILVFSAVALMTFGAVREAERILNQRRRLSAPGEVSRASLTPLWAQRAGESAFFRWVLASTSISDTQERERLRQALVLAGIDNPNAPIWFVIVRFTLAISLPLLFLLLQSLSANPAMGLASILWPMTLCCVGLFGPGRLLSYWARARQNRLEHEFPDALDLMVVCVEGGLSLDAAFIRVGQEVAESHPDISREFERVSEQLRAGRARPDALRAMASRTGVPAIKSFVALLIQTEMLGAGIAQTLRTFSSEMRQTRFIKAEEKAMRLPVLMTIPLVTCILPVIVTALLLPAIIAVVRTLVPALTGSN